MNVASTASRTGAHVLLISTALVTPKNRWSPYRILLNTVIRYNRANEKVSHVLYMRLSFSQPHDQQNFDCISSF